MRIITKTKELEDFSRELRAQPFVAVDTEFMREKTFWPILCLIQAAAEGTEAIIDPLADGLDLSSFYDVLTDASVVKVFHAARQDVEIFYRRLEAVPAPLFDTQIAAMACGFGDQIGYEPLMRTLLKAKIDKGSRFTDWSRRPLTEAQLSYAMSDVTHLREAYPLLLAQLKSQNRAHWVEEEMKALLNADLYYVQPSEAWRRLRLKGVRPKELGVLMKLAEWREREAQTRDVPRSRILKDEAIFELSRLQPGSAKDLARARSIPKGYERSSAAAGILSTIEEGLKAPKSSLPEVEKQAGPKAPGDIVDLLKVLLKTQCEKFDVAPKLIASASDLEEIALNDDADVAAMTGWRREVFGDAAMKLKRGEVALQLNEGAIEIVNAF
ncbi:MAG: ribonuclease D [Pseudomonadota bacterium]